MSQTVPMRTDPRRFAPSAASVSGLSIGEYLIRRLEDYGIGHVFGIPGDYVLGFYSLLEKSRLGVIGCTREDLRGIRGRCLRPGTWHGSRLRHVLRGGVEPVQFDRRRLCRKVAGGGDHRFAGFERAGEQSAAAPPGARFSHAVRRIRQALHRRCRAERAAGGVPRDRPRIARGGQLQAAGLYRDSARHGRRGARPAASVPRSAGQQRSGGAG